MKKRKKSEESVSHAKNAGKNDLGGFENFRGGSIRFYIRHCGDLPVLKPDEVAKLTDQMLTGKNGAKEKAREKLIKHNMKLVFFWAREITRLNKMDINDAIGEGMFGLLEALETFNPAKGAIGTHLGWGIRHNIWRSYSNIWYGGNFRLPVNTYQQEKKIIKLLEELNASGDDRKKETTDKLQKRLHQIMSVKESSLSFNEPIDSENDDDFSIDLIPCDHDSPEKKILDGSLRETLIAILDPEINTRGVKKSRLNLKEWDVLSRRFGLTDGWEKTLEEVGTDCKLTRERVRQIEASALKKAKSLLLKRGLHREAVF